MIENIFFGACVAVMGAVGIFALFFLDRPDKDDKREDKKKS